MDAITRRSGACCARRAREKGSCPGACSGLCVGASTLLFLLWDGPSWRHADAADAAAWWSYAFIPPLVAGALLIERKLGALALVLATIEVTAWKFFATYCFAQTMWMISPPKTPAAPRPS